MKDFSKGGYITIHRYKPDGTVDWEDTYKGEENYYINEANKMEEILFDNHNEFVKQSIFDLESGIQNEKEILLKTLKEKLSHDYFVILFKNYEKLFEKEIDTAILDVDNEEITLETLIEPNNKNIEFNNLLIYDNTENQFIMHLKFRKCIKIPNEKIRLQNNIDFVKC